MYKGRTQVVASLASKMKHLVAAAPDQAYTVNNCSCNFTPCFGIEYHSY